jgi:hypothetical protein
MSTRIHQLCLAIGGLILSSGCAMCCGLYDNDYLATSELLQRTDPSHSRVGSVFSDPQAGVPVGWTNNAETLPTESLPTPRETLPEGETSYSSEPNLASPQQQTTPIPQEISPIPQRVPTQGVSVREDLQSRRSAGPSNPNFSPAPRRLSVTMGTPLQNSPRFERQPVRQVSGRR